MECAVAEHSDGACDVLRNAPFDSCHSTVDPESYIANYKHDFCNCSMTTRSGRDVVLVIPSPIMLELVLKLAGTLKTR